MKFKNKADIPKICSKEEPSIHNKCFPLLDMTSSHPHKIFWIGLFAFVTALCLFAVCYFRDKATD